MHNQSWNSQRSADLTGETKYFECPAQEPCSKYSVANQMGEELSGDATNLVMYRNSPRAADDIHTCYNTLLTRVQ